MSQVFRDAVPPYVTDLAPSHHGYRTFSTACAALGRMASPPQPVALVGQDNPGWLCDSVHQLSGLGTVVFSLPQLETVLQQEIVNLL